MHTPFKTIGILGKPSDPGIATTLSVLYGYLKQHYNVLVASESAVYIDEKSVNSCAAEQLGQRCDLVIAVGGDGTFLSAVRVTADYDVPVNWRKPWTARLSSRYIAQ